MSDEITEANRDRPSSHGSLMGHALSQIAEAGRRSTAMPIPDPCLTCAFRPGCMTNQMAAVGLVAFNCVVGIDDSVFSCHHGLKDGQPSRPCFGYWAAKLAPWSFTKEVVANLVERLKEVGDGDQIRAAFEAWRDEADPGKILDDYQLARLYEKRTA